VLVPIRSWGEGEGSSREDCGSRYRGHEGSVHERRVDLSVSVSGSVCVTESRMYDWMVEERM